MNRIVNSALGLGLGLGIGLGLAIGGASAETVSLKLASFTPPKSNVVAGTYVPFIKAVKADLGDKIDLKEFWGGALGRNPTKQYELVKNGIADVNLLVAGYTPGQFPGATIFELPYLIRSGLEGSVAAWRLHDRAGMIGGIEDIHVLSVWTPEPYGIHTSKPMKSIADVKGLKLRSAGPVQGALAKHYGAIAVGMAVPKAAEAIRRGVLDGALIGWGGSNTFKVYKVTKYHYLAPLGALTFILAANKERWASLPADVKQVIEKHAGEKWARLGGTSFDETANKLYNSLKDDKSRTFITPSEDELKAALEDTRAVHRDWIARTPNGEKVYGALLEILADYRKGS